MKEQYELFDTLYTPDKASASSTPAIVELRIEDVMPSRLNPRKVFDQAALDALAAAI